ncbi:DUF6415 family natural product biosynthesis protein [Streptomyces sp. NPDC002928]|uniref:DUF6415 family natural product biosynthesis protein n=1 Tax=Streptomyces sp. NPDC002928 TaxID=3154440 RepID=UPI0033AA554F
MSALKTGTNLVDIPAIRRSISLLLPHHQAHPLADAELAALTKSLRVHTHLLIAQIEQAAARRPAEDVPRYVALACTRQARTKLHAHPGPGRHGAARNHNRRCANDNGILMAIPLSTLNAPLPL